MSRINYVPQGAQYKRRAAGTYYRINGEYVEMFCPVEERWIVQRTTPEFFLSHLKAFDKVSAN